MLRALFAASCLMASGTACHAASATVADADYDWIDVANLDIGGRGYRSCDEPFVRLPKIQRDVAPASLRSMACESTGLNLRFKTNSRKIVFRYVTAKKLWTDPLVPPSGLQSVSLWERRENVKGWEYVGKNHPDSNGTNEYVVGWRPKSVGLLYFPMRSVVKEFKVGVERGCVFETVPYTNPGKVVVYGTSIVHGGCVSSAGMMFTSFMGRRLDRDVVNLGFSGAGKMELQMADVVSGVDAAIYVIDCDWNMTVDMQKERYEPFVRRLRRLRPSTPILLCGGCTEGDTPRAQEVFAKSVYDRLRAEEGGGRTMLHFLSGVEALPKCSWATHDHCHPNDYGAPFMGDVYARRVAEILGRNDAGKRHIVAVNDDNTRFFMQSSSMMTEDALNAFIDSMAGGKVTHLFMCPSGQRPSYASKVWEPIWTGLDEPGGDQKNGQTMRARNAKILFDKGIDPYEVWIRRCRERGISPWLSPRMNDCHNANEQAPFRSTTFWRTHEELHCEPGYRGPDWNRATLNFAKDEVQDYTFALVKEQLDRYDVDGYELDFMRFHDHFPRNTAPQSARHLDRFVKRVKAYVDKKAEERGHQILLGVRVATTPKAARAKGCDVGTWVREGWVDWVCASTYWETPDYNTPVKEWREWFGDRADEVVLLSGTDHGVRAVGRGGVRIDMEMKYYAGFADVQWCNGVDGLYLFNITFIADELANVCRHGLFPEDLPRQMRSYPVSFRSEAWGGAPNDMQLPRTSDVANELSIRLGTSISGDVSVFVGVKESGDFCPDVELNGHKAFRSETETMRKKPKGVSGGGVEYAGRRYFFQNGSVHSGAGNIVRIGPTKEPRTIMWCEIDIIPSGEG